jgi:hypothetical protein
MKVTIALAGATVGEGAAARNPTMMIENPIVIVAKIANPVLMRSSSST